MSEEELKMPEGLMTEEEARKKVLSSPDFRMYLQMWLPYFKQGDDFSGCLEATQTLGEACEAHAQIMEDSARQLRALKEFLGGLSAEELAKVSMEGCTHMISLSAPLEISQKLLDLKIVFNDPITYEEALQEEVYDLMDKELSEALGHTEDDIEEGA